MLSSITQLATVSPSGEFAHMKRLLVQPVIFLSLSVILQPAVKMMRYFILILCMCKLQVEASDWFNRTIRVDLSTNRTNLARQNEILVNSERSLNGVNATNGQYPWSILTIAWSNLGFGSWVGTSCAGSIISENFALTDIHCTGQDLEPGPATVIEAFVGGVRWVSPLPTPRYMRHYWYIEPSPSAENSPNIVLLQFHERLTYNPNIHPIRLAAPGNFSYEGWASLSLGFNTPAGIFSAQLEFVSTSIPSNGACTFAGNLANYEMCAIEAGAGNEGGPITRFNAFIGGAWVTYEYDNYEYHSTLVAIHQFQYANATSSFGVATRVSPFVEWVEQLTAEAEV
ncbi:Transmembrane protease serine 11D [Pseudolycoriella hygida]|uniref:Transmembrane protease serine 11D n=1 Tax=Pseudolycoriella hygida TaxID=35572 RepID=A0A9Q0SA06_9DIPT|nr:Transmembrane protease serine 11D [Pseudolycoriella hygida]